MTHLSPDSDTLKTPWGYLRFLVVELRWWALPALAAVFLAAVISQSSTIVIKYIVDTLESGVTAQFYWLALLFPISIFATSLFYRVGGILAVYFGARAKERSNVVLFSYVLSHGKEYFSDRQAGAVLSKINNVVDSVDHFLEYALWNYFDTLITFITSLALLFWVAPWAAAAYFALAVIVVVCNIPLTKTKATLAEAASKMLTTLRGQMVDVFSNTDAVRLYTRSHDESVGAARLSRNASEAEITSGVYSEKILLLNGVLFLLGFAVVTLILLAMHQQGLVTTGDLVMVMVLISQNTYVILFFGTALQRGSEHYGQVKEGLSDIFLPHVITNTAGAAPLVVQNGEIAWTNVTFTFGNNNVFNDFSLTIPAGQRVGLVGSSGAGKSTFVSLLLRQHDVASGAISIDGQDIATVTQDSLRGAVAVVPQEPLLFHRTIRENIAYGKPDATNEEIEAVAKKAYAYDFIAALPEKYDTLVGERGVKLSGGQKQRIAIARAMLKNAPILILDEATSALDSESEVTIQKALHELMVGKTVIAIAHRLSTLREMDRIIVLENGAIIEDGRHETLVAAGGTYARLWAHQSGGFV